MAANSDGILYCGAHGRRSVAERARMTKDTVFRLPSMLLPIASVAALQLFDSGALDLDDRMDAIVGEPVHFNARPGADAAYPPGAAPSMRQVLARMADSDQPVGDVQISWVRLAVERVSGMRLDDYVRRYILEPLEMQDTHFSLPASLWTRLAGMHHQVAPGVIRSTSPMEADSALSRSNRASFYSTAPDMLGFLSALLRRDPRLLSPSGYRELARTHGSVSRAADVLACGGSFNTYCWVDRRSDTSGLMFTQLFPHAYQPLSVVFDSFRSAVHQENGMADQSSRFDRAMELLNPFRGEVIWWV
jgi:CubicO group peptidase (beta-lactamase class C family)